LFPSGSYVKILTLLFVLVPLAGSGQTSISSDTLALPEFEIKSSFTVDNHGFKKIKIDSGFLIPMIGADLSAVLTQHSTVYIKSYGNGSLASPSFRGTSAHHTQVQWNGISLNSPMLGQMDFSQVPVSQFDAIEVLYGPAGISQAGGAFGGVINLVTKPDWSNRQSILFSQGAGSFSTFLTNVNLVAGTEHFQAHMKFNRGSSVNNFPFTADNGEIVRQKNASYSQSGVSQEMFWRTGDKHMFSTKFWYSEDHRNLQPTTQNYNADKTETMDDKAFRAVLEYKYVTPGLNLNLRTMLNDQFSIYNNSTTGINSAHYSTSWINKIRLTTLFKALTCKAGLDYTFDRVHSDDYNSLLVQRNTLSLITEFNYDFGSKVKTLFMIREELVDGTFGLPTAALGFDYKPFNIDFSVNANVSHNYRIPTLNDLYWGLGGNPWLKPESNFSMEAGSTWRSGPIKKKFYVEVNGAAYYSKIYSMITWTSVGGGSIWTPENVDEIFARGIETGLNLTSDFFGFHLVEMINYHFCRSTYEKTSSPNDEKLGKQQVYIPVHTLNASFNAERWNFYLKYNYIFYSERFTGTDNSYIMPAYSISNLILGKNINVNKIVLTLQLDINNLFNLDYQSMPSRPMPGINKMLTIRVNF
jgi:iron complex outermembrane receptor protein